MTEAWPGRAVRIATMALVLLVGATLRLWGMDDPLGARAGAPWREGDIGAITQSFVEEGYAPFHPRIAWRGDGPGFVESELPILPLAAAPFARVTSDVDLTVRVIAGLVSVVNLLLFFLAAWWLLPPLGAIAASALFAVSPIPVYLGGAAQPDGLMMLFLLLSFTQVVRFVRGKGDGALVLAGLALGVAILAKASAAHFGLLLAGIVVWRYGLRSLARPGVWAAAVLAIAPGVAWYVWAHQFWTEWGNSLGLSNETHLFGIGVLRHPELLVGIARHEVARVFSISGALLGAWALVQAVREWRSGRTPHFAADARALGQATVLALAWGGAAAVFYVVFARTAGDPWAFYYHAISAPPAALLMGAGFSWARDMQPDGDMWGRIVVGAGLGAAALAVAVLLVEHPGPLLLGTAFLVLVAGFGALVRPAASLDPDLQRLASCAAPLALVVLVAGSLIGLGARAVASKTERDPGKQLEARRLCAVELAAKIPAGALIAVRGGASTDAEGNPVAYAESMLFYWMNRHGFVLADDHVTVERISALADRGARYYLDTPERLERDLTLSDGLNERWREAGRCNTLVAYELGEPELPRIAR